MMLLNYKLLLCLAALTSSCLALEPSPDSTTGGDAFTPLSRDGTSSITLTTTLRPEDYRDYTPRYAEEDDSGEDDGNTEDDSGNQQPQPHKHRSLIGLLLSPIRATIRTAKRLFGVRDLSGARDLVAGGFSELQTRTYRMFMRAYNKSYSLDELPRRMALFFERRALIEQSVREFARGTLPFAMRENTFTDWDESELKRLAGVSPPTSVDEMTDEERATAAEGASSESQSLEYISGGGAGAGSEQDFIEWTTGDDNGDNSTTSTRQDDATSLSVSRAFSADDSGNLSVRAVERIPATMDWRTSGCVATPINQLKCGACYAIATVGALESMRCINRVASSPILSSQQVVDCSRAYKNYGCDGGWPTRVLKYLQDTRVAARESCYPFVRRANTCKLRSVSASSSSCTVRATATDGSQQLNYKVLSNERDILYHVAKTGPVITVMRATDSFLYYGKGIFDDPKCSRKRDDVDHAIVIVGYGRENNQDYWLIKNSWGTDDWGLDGYGKYKRGTNACSIGHWGWVITS